MRKQSGVEITRRKVNEIKSKKVTIFVYFKIEIYKLFLNTITQTQLSMTRQMQYNFLYPVHNITNIHCAVPLSLLTAQHSQTVLNTEQCGAVRQRAICNS